MAKGLSSIRMHRADSGIATALETLAASTAAAPIAPADIDPEAAARRYLNAMIHAGAELGTLHDAAAETRPEYKYLGIDKIPFTGTRHVKFRQHFHKIPVYGSIVTVELGVANEFISINSSIGNPADIDPVASIAPADVLKMICAEAGYEEGGLCTPARLFFYFDVKTAAWRLVYVVEDVVRRKSRYDRKAGPAVLPECSDFVIDAHTGDVVDELPRTQTMAAEDVSSDGIDGLGQRRSFGALQDDAQRKMHDRPRNIRTHDFDFQDAFFQQFALPGDLVAIPPEPWDPGGVSAHANAREVVDFLREVLMRDGLDDQGGPIVSSVNCVFETADGSREWRNAARFRGQMIYGQREVAGELRSYAVSLDVVAHELLHGLTENTARLEYRFESGALNESYSDIFGVIVSNIDQPDVGAWNWEMGEDLSESGIPIRSLSDPTLHGQPAHMDDFVVLTEDQDNGGVHINSGIHNKAAFLLLTTRSQAGGFLLTPVEVARLYYVTLVAHLSRTSDFADCRAGMRLTAQSLFGTDPAAGEKLDAIEAAYDAVGIRPGGIA